MDFFFPQKKGNIFKNRTIKLRTNIFACVFEKKKEMPPIRKVSLSPKSGQIFDSHLINSYYVQGKANSSWSSEHFL